MKKILILTSGKKSKLRLFATSKRDLKIELTLSSFDEISFNSGNGELLLKGGIKLTNFDVIYFRLVGKALETAALVTEYAKKNRIQIVDRIYENSQVFPITQSKAQEMKALADAKIAIPETFFGSLTEITGKSKKAFGFPFVIKSTSGSRGREVYSPQDSKALKSLMVQLLPLEKAGKKYFSQKFIKCTKRVRLLVIDGKIIGSVSQLTKWRRRVDSYAPIGDEMMKIEKFTPDADMQKLALSAVRATGIDIAGVDVLIEEDTDKYFVIEVNAAPSWKLIKEYCKINVEYEILKFVSKSI